MSKKSILVIFGQDPPRKSKKWLSQFDKVLGPKEVEELISSGSVQEAHRLLNKLPYLTISDGRRVSKLINYQGYELWWIHYDNLMDRFCLPFTQYSRLLEFLKNFSKIYLYQPPASGLFQYFLRANNCQYIIFKRFQLRNLLPIPLGVFIQIVLSLGFLLWLKTTKPGLMVWTGDIFDTPRTFDFRNKFIYKELMRRRVPFVEFIRSLESWSTILKHAWQRKRPVVYSAAIIDILHFFAGCFGENKKKELGNLSLPSGADPEKRFWFLVAAHHLGNLRGTIWSIRAMKFILEWIGVRAAIMIAGSSRNFHEILACKLAGIKTVGIQHGFTPRYYPVADFMPAFDGELSISLDRYGLWSDWWKEYYIAHSRIFKPEQLYVSGLLRPIEKKIKFIENNHKPDRESIKVLFVGEQLADPKEVMPYLIALSEEKDFFLYLKLRPNRDGFEGWLKKHQPDILEKVRIFRGSPQQAIAESDVVVGSHSTAVLEALLQLKPLVFFWTNKWGDYYEIKSFDSQKSFFAENPKELIALIRKSRDIPEQVLKQLQERFFGNPEQDGGKWVVEQAIEFAKNYGRE